MTGDYRPCKPAFFQSLAAVRACSKLQQSLQSGNGHGGSKGKHSFSSISQATYTAQEPLDSALVLLSGLWGSGTSLWSVYTSKNALKRPHVTAKQMLPHQFSSSGCQSKSPFLDWAPWAPAFCKADCPLPGNLPVSRPPCLKITRARHAWAAVLPHNGESTIAQARA